MNGGKEWGERGTGQGGHGEKKEKREHKGGTGETEGIGPGHSAYPLTERRRARAVRRADSRGKAPETTSHRQDPIAVALSPCPSARPGHCHSPGPPERERHRRRLRDPGAGRAGPRETGAARGSRETPPHPTPPRRGQQPITGLRLSRLPPPANGSAPPLSATPAPHATPGPRCGLRSRGSSRCSRVPRYSGLCWYSRCSRVPRCSGLCRCSGVPGVQVFQVSRSLPVFQVPPGAAP